MKTIKLFYDNVLNLFCKEIKENEFEYVISPEKALDMFIKMYPEVTKVEILELIEYSFLSNIVYAYFNSKSESDESVPIPLFEYNNTSNNYHASYISEYYNIIGHLFLSGYVDFMVNLPQETLLSEYMEDKYKAWIHFRNNFLYKEAFKNYGYDIFLYNGKEYTEQTCPYIMKDNLKYFLGTMPAMDDVSWDEPKYWSPYNVYTVATKKGTEYLENELTPRIISKYKDLEVEVDENYNIIKWIGQVNR